MSRQSNTTNVKVATLNYHSYAAAKYDREIVRVIPGHEEIHKEILKIVKSHFGRKLPYNVLDLGVGTGLTSALIQRVLTKAHFDVIDFSRPMLQGSRQRLDVNRTKYIFGDYSKVPPKKDYYDLVISVIGLHHQTDAGKQKVIRKVFRALKPGGYFLLADLMTYRNKKEAALNQARHFHHLVTNARDKNVLSDWAYHHVYLNQLASIEGHIKWFRETGFKTQKNLQEINTTLLVGSKV